MVNNRQKVVNSGKDRQTLSLIMDSGKSLISLKLQEPEHLNFVLQFHLDLGTFFQSLVAEIQMV